MKRRRTEQRSRGDFLRKLLNDYIAEHGDVRVNLNDVFRDEDLAELAQSAEYPEGPPEESES